MKKPDFTKLGVFAIIALIAFIAEKRKYVLVRDEDVVIKELRKLHEEYNSTFNKNDRDNLALQVIIIIENNANLRLPSDLESFVLTSMVTPTE